MANAIALAKMLRLGTDECCSIVATRTSGKLNMADVLRIFLIVTSGLLRWWMSIHFTCALTKIRNNLPKKGPA